MEVPTCPRRSATRRTNGRAGTRPPRRQALVRAADGGRREVSLLLEGIHCGACIWLIESWLSGRPGVVHASVNFATRRARVVWDPGQARLSDLLRAVVAVGYRAYPYDPARREALARRESRALLSRLAVALLAMMQVMMFAVPTYVTIDGVEPAHRRLLEWASFTLTLPVLLYSAAPFFRGAWRDLRLRRPGMDVPVALGLAAAFVGSAWATFRGGGAVYYDSVTMFVALLLCARYVEFVARRRAGDAVEAVARARPATAERLRAWPERNDVETVGAAALAAGELVLVRPGSTVPADGEVVDGRAHVEAAILTGETKPHPVAPGDAVLAGSVARDGALVIRVTAAGEATRLAAIERLAERAAGERPRIARVADRIAAWFVGALLVLAGATAVVWWQLDPSRVLAVTFAVLVVSCPCALSLATPAALAAAAGALSRRQIVVARADALETLSRVTHVVFDKTGTLTTGRVVLRNVLPLGGATRTDALALAAALEAQSEHAVARALRDAVPQGLPLPEARDLAVVPGNGVEGFVGGRRVRIGRPEFVAALSGRPVPAEAAGFFMDATGVALGDDTGFLALFALGDALRPGAASLVARLRASRDRPAAVVGRRRGRRRGCREGAGNRRCPRRRAAGGQARRRRAAAGCGRHRGHGRGRHQRRAVARAGPGFDQPRQRDAARAMDGGRRRSFRRDAARRRRHRSRTPHLSGRPREPRVGVRLQCRRDPGCGIRSRDPAGRGARDVGVVAARRGQCVARRTDGRRRRHRRDGAPGPGCGLNRRLRRRWRSCSC